MTGEARSLTEYAKTRPAHHGRVPWFETLPEATQQEIIDGFNAGISVSVITEWLRDHGHDDVTAAKVDGYLTTRGFKTRG